jgi:hypothetical protein
LDPSLCEDRIEFLGKKPIPVVGSEKSAGESREGKEFGLA